MCQGEAAWAWPFALLLLLSASAQLAWASESPDRECCEPLYPFIPPPAAVTPAPGYPTTPTFNNGDDINFYFTTLPPPTVPTSSRRPAFVDVTIEQQEIATRPRPGSLHESSILRVFCFKKPGQQSSIH